MLSPADLLGIGIVAAGDPQAEVEPETPHVLNLLRPLESGSVEARALFELYAGEAAVLVKSPPGAGKSTLVARIVARLVGQDAWKVVVACVTKNACADIAESIATALGWTEGDPPVVFVESWPAYTERPGWLARDGASLSKGVVVRTLASCEMSPPACELLVIDEAYQATYASFANAADAAEQVLLVGDPGQIGPVIQGDTRLYESHTGRISPHAQAPHALAMPGSPVTPIVLNLTTTYRVGPDTVEALRPLYDFRFESSRPQRTMFSTDRSVTYPEIASMELPVATKADIASMTAVADAAQAMIGRHVDTVHANGVKEATTIDPSSVAVVVAHRDQRAAVAAILESRGLGGISVGTADSLQGGQWLGVVALDPCVGHPEAGQHQLTPGRLCVMASRHMAHLMWVHDGTWLKSLEAVASDPQASARTVLDAQAGIAVRRALVG